MKAAADLDLDQERGAYLTQAQHDALTDRAREDFSALNAKLVNGKLPLPEHKTLAPRDAELSINQVPAEDLFKLTEKLGLAVPSGAQMPQAFLDAFCSPLIAAIRNLPEAGERTTLEAEFDSRLSRALARISDRRKAAEPG